MMEDIAPDLLKKIQSDFRLYFDKSTVISELYEKLRDGTATYLEANKFAIETGNILAEAYKNNLSSAVLPDGKMYYNIAQRIIEPTMENNYLLITDVTNQVQKSLNEAAGIGIKAITPELNWDRIEKIVDRVADAEQYDDIAWILDEPVKNFSQSIVDDSICSNADFHYKAGMTPKIVRKLAGGCCEWCNKLSGTYRYPDVPKDVYRRHQRCRCTVEYNPGDGKIQNVHSKKWHKEDEYQLISSKSKDTKQQYLPVKGNEIVKIADRRLGNMIYTKIDGYDEVYVANGINIKPKALHSINKNISDAIKAYNGKSDFKPKICIVDKGKLSGALGKYDCVQNIIYISPDVGDRRQLSVFSALDKNIKMGSTEYHECWHWMQAQSYGKTITYESRDTEYMPWLIDKCKKNIESLGITGYNVNEISDYAEISFIRGRFDEVEAEFYVKKMLKRV